MKSNDAMLPLLTHSCSGGLRVDCHLQLFMAYSRVPEDFMRDIFIAPHSFNDPENPQHGEYVNMQLRNDLYFSTLHEISNIEFAYLSSGGEEEWIKVEKFNDCRGELNWFNGLSSDYKKKMGRTLNGNSNRKVEMIACQEWEIAYHKGSERKLSNYRVHVLQTDTDIFKTEIFPPTLPKTLKDLLLN